MNGKTHESLTDHAETDDLRLAVKELNQSIAYLSKMILQLQRSMNNGKPEKPSTPQEKPGTIH
jgi:hypothetical protein